MRVPFWQWRHGGPVRRGLFYAMLEGGVVGGMFAAIEVWMVPLLQTRLGAAAFVIGLLTIIPQLGMFALSPAIRTLISRLGGAKQATIRPSWIQVAALLLLLLPVHLPSAAWAVPLAVAMICLIGLSFVVIGPAWVGWTSTLVPRTISGSYQARRMRLFNATKLLFAGLFAWIAHVLPLDAGPWGMSAILLVATASRLASIWCLSRQPEMPERPRLAPLSARSAEAATGLGGFLRTIMRTDAGRWTLVWSAFVGGVMVAGPFFASYMIAPQAEGGLGLRDFDYTLLLYASVVVRILFYPLVGRMVDLYGPRAVLRISMALILLLPIAWALSTSLWVLLLNEVVAGIAWAGAEIAIGALLFTAHSDANRRAELVGYFNTVAAACIVAGTVIGTALIDLVPPIAGSRYHTIFLLSLLLRLPGLYLALRWLPGLRAIRPGEGGSLVRTLPGVELVSAFGRGLATLFRRPID
jgi:hypothetical protein